MDFHTGNEVAIELEHVRTEPSVLKGEADIYRYLAGGAAIPRTHLLLTECEYYCMTFDLLGPSLEDLFHFCGRKFFLKTVLMLAHQLLSHLEFIHSHGVIYSSRHQAGELLDGNGIGQHLLYRRFRYCDRTSSYPREHQCQPSFIPSKCGTICQRRRHLP